jgi:DNA polymerase-1
LRVVVNIEANGLKPTKIWCIVCKDIDSGVVHVFREKDHESFRRFSEGVTHWIGHNYLGYDAPSISHLYSIDVHRLTDSCTDTLVISKMADYPRQGHSTTHYAQEFGIDKPTQPSFSAYSEELVDYCKLIVEITEKIFNKYRKFIDNVDYRDAIALEHSFQLCVNNLCDNGFAFNKTKAEKYLHDVTHQLNTVDQDISAQFPPKLKLIREIHPKVTQHGTLHKGDFRFVKDGDLSQYNGGPFCRCSWAEFNPSSHKQLIDVLAEAGWKPTDRTATAIDTEREINKLKHQRSKDTLVDLRLKELYTKAYNQEKFGWKINETNLSTLPSTAPSSARLLAQRILLEARRRTLTEWLGLVQDDGRIHGKFYGIGAWTHRMAHQAPNTANIPNEFDTAGNKKLLGKEMRSLWQAPKNRLLVGVDAEGIQLRIFAHYIDDKEFTQSLVDGKKENKSDPHSLNQRILGPLCKSRAAAKRFIYALLLGAGIGKLAEILSVSENEARSALDRLMERYEGFTRLKEDVIPADARRGWFKGLDGRAVRIPGDTTGMRKHLCMSGYLQNGEAVIMKKACLLWHKQLADIPGWKLVNFVHDEWQTECPNNVDTALHIAKVQADSLRIVGEQLNLKCPLAGSYYNDDIKDYTISTNWAYTH